MKINRKDGSVVECEWYNSVLLDELGQVVSLFSLVLDVSDRNEAQRELKEQTERLQTILDNIPVMIGFLEEDSQVKWVNQEWVNVLGWSEEEMREIDIWAQFYPDPEDRARVINYIQEATPIWKDFQTRTREGKIIETSWANVQLSDGSIIGIGQDITERKQADEDLRRLALHDHLTGLPNRNLFMDRLEQAIKRTEKQDHYLFAVLLIDLDRFKVVNDSLGHDVGDQLLTAIARRLTQCISPPSTVARFGGDEFVILLENLNTWGEATQVAERISEQLRASFILEGREFFTSASIGITFASSPEQSAGEVLRNADIAMYRAKERGKARYTIFDPVMHAQVRRELEIDTNLRLALERQEFLVYYQPIVCLMTQKLIGFEALVRWQHPEKGLVSPAEFIPIAEETGLILPLGEWVLRESCRQMKAWQEQFTGAKSLKILLEDAYRRMWRNWCHILL